jgi:hypothetical protein
LLKVTLNTITITLHFQTFHGSCVWSFQRVLLFVVTQHCFAIIFLSKGSIWACGKGN